MENKINIVELLKDCPKGMELDCTMFEGIEFDSIVDNETFPIRCRIKNSNDEYNFYNFTKHGYWNNDYKAKCVIFPKGKTTWEGFNRSFKDGDVVVAEDSESQLFLLKKYLNKDSSSYDGYCYFGWDFQNNTLFEKGNWRFDRLATKEEKEKLFQTIKDNGYHWDEETKTLEKLPKFKVGDRIKHKDSGLHCTLGNYSEGISAYRTNIGLAIKPKDLEQWELVPNKFDINTLKPFDKVLVRDFNSEVWEIDFFSRLIDGKHFKCIGSFYVQCIPYEGNEHLHGTTNACSDYFKTWEK